MNTINPQKQEVHQTQKKFIPKYTIIKLLKANNNKQKMLKATRTGEITLLSKEKKEKETRTYSVLLSFKKCE